MNQTIHTRLHITYYNVITVKKYGIQYSCTQCSCSQNLCLCDLFVKLKPRVRLDWGKTSTVHNMQCITHAVLWSTVGLQSDMCLSFYRVAVHSQRSSFLLSKGFSFLFEVLLFFAFFCISLHDAIILRSFLSCLLCLCIALVQLDLILQAETRQSKCKYIRSYFSSASAAAATMWMHKKGTASKERKKHYYSPTFMFRVSFALLCIALKLESWNERTDWNGTEEKRRKNANPRWNIFFTLFFVFAHASKWALFWDYLQWWWFR